jgi:porin
MSTPVRGRAFVAALVLAVTAPAGFAEEVPVAPPPPTVEVETPTHLPDFPDLARADLAAALPALLPGADAVDRLISPTLIPLPGAEAFGWFADAPVHGAAAGAAPCGPCVPCVPPPVCPPSWGGSLCCRPKLLGDWGGLRPHLAERGLNFDLYSTNFYSQVFNGGLQETAQYRGRLDLLLNINGERAGLWKGLFIDLHGESIWGNTINQYTGALSPVSIAQAVPVPNGAVAALTGVKFTQFLSENFLVYGGKINTLDDYHQPFTGGGRGVDGFWNTAFAFNPIFARTVPYSAYGFGAAYLRNLEPVLSFAVLDALSTPTTTGFSEFFDNGVVLVPAINIPTNFRGRPGHQGISGTWSSRRYLNTDRSAFLNVLQGAPVSTLRRDGAWSLAYNFDQALRVSPCDPRRMWGVFGNLGLADTNPSPIRWFASLGVGGSALRGRPLDTFGMGYYYLGLNRSFKDLLPGRLRDEHGLEAFYNFAVTPWCHITPDVQFILPALQRAEHMWFFGLRAKLDF